MYRGSVWVEVQGPVLPVADDSGRDWDILRAAVGASTAKPTHYTFVEVWREVSDQDSVTSALLHDPARGVFIHLTPDAVLYTATEGSPLGEYIPIGAGAFAPDPCRLYPPFAVLARQDGSPPLHPDRLFLYAAGNHFLGFSRPVGEEGEPSSVPFGASSRLAITTNYAGSIWRETSGGNRYTFREVWREIVFESGRLPTHRLLCVMLYDGSPGRSFFVLLSTDCGKIMVVEPALGGGVPTVPTRDDERWIMGSFPEGHFVGEGVDDGYAPVTTPARVGTTAEAPIVAHAAPANLTAPAVPLAPVAAAPSSAPVLPAPICTPDVVPTPTAAAPPKTPVPTVVAAVPVAAPAPPSPVPPAPAVTPATPRALAPFPTPASTVAPAVVAATASSRVPAPVSPTPIIAPPDAVVSSSKRTNQQSSPPLSSLSPAANNATEDNPRARMLEAALRRRGVSSGTSPLPNPPPPDTTSTPNAPAQSASIAFGNNQSLLIGIGVAAVALLSIWILFLT